LREPSSAKVLSEVGEGQALVSVRGALSRIAAGIRGDRAIAENRYGRLHDLYVRIAAAGIFDPETYLSLNPDVRNAGADPWWHLLYHGLEEGRPFTSAESVAEALAWTQKEYSLACNEYLKNIKRSKKNKSLISSWEKKIKIGIYCSTKGNFYMNEIADLLYMGLHNYGIDVFLRDETHDEEENLDLRIFVAPHEFFFLGEGVGWRSVIKQPNTILYNVEQIQTQWFGKAFHLLLQAPLVFDINWQTAQVLRKAGCNVIFFMPGYIENSLYTRSEIDISSVNLAKGYKFSKENYDWQKNSSFIDRPIDVLFFGSKTPYRDNSLSEIESIANFSRFICVYRDIRPFVREKADPAAMDMNWALSQRSKIVLNLHRDWIGYFEWSRMVLRGFWHGTCVVTDPGLPTIIFEPGVHYLEESARHLPELIRWLLLTEEGKAKMQAVAQAGFQRAQHLGSMEVALTPLLEAFGNLLKL
jgi:hypothetical protein